MVMMKGWPDFVVLGGGPCLPFAMNSGTLMNIGTRFSMLLGCRTQLCFQVTPPLCDILLPLAALSAGQQEHSLQKPQAYHAHAGADTNKFLLVANSRPLGNNLLMTRLRHHEMMMVKRK